MAASLKISIGKVGKVSGGKIPFASIHNGSIGLFSAVDKQITKPKVLPVPKGKIPKAEKIPKPRKAY